MVICIAIGLFLFWRWIIMVSFCSVIVFVILMLDITLESPQDGTDRRVIRVVRWPFLIGYVILGWNISDKRKARRGMKTFNKEPSISWIRPSGLMFLHSFTPFWSCSAVFHHSIRFLVYYMKLGIATTEHTLSHSHSPRFACTSTHIVDRVGRSYLDDWWVSVA